jgi:WD40 repeat protein
VVAILFYTCSSVLFVYWFTVENYIFHFMGSFTTMYSSYFVCCHPFQGEGTLLATGSYDGQARIWSRDGE